MDLLMLIPFISVKTLMCMTLCDWVFSSLPPSYAVHPTQLPSA